MAVTLPVTNGTDTCQTLSILTAIHTNPWLSHVTLPVKMILTPVKRLSILTAIHIIIIRIPNIIPTVDNYSKSMYIIITQNKSYSTLSIVYNACHLIGIKQRYDKAGFKYKTQSSQKYSYIVNDLTL